MLKASKIAVIASVLYVSTGYIYEMVEGFKMPFYRFNPNTDLLIYWLSLRSSVALAFYALYEQLKDTNSILSYITIALGITPLVNEIVTQFFFYGESENDTLAMVLVGLAVVFMLWQKRKKS